MPAADFGWYFIEQHGNGMDRSIRARGGGGGRVILFYSAFEYLDKIDFAMSNGDATVQHSSRRCCRFCRQMPSASQVFTPLRNNVFGTTCWRENCGVGKSIA